LCAKVSKKELQTTFFKQLLLYNISFIKLLTSIGRDKKMKTSKKEKDYPKEQGSLSHIINILKLSHINVGIHILATY
jgi:hypothetical protein